VDSWRTIKRAFCSLAALSALVLLARCSGCGTRSFEPLKLVGKHAEVAFDIPDVGAPAKRKAQLFALFEGVIPKDQIEALESEGKRLLGFDPTTAEGMKQAGLRPEGPAAVELAEAGRSALWIVGVDDEGKFGAAVKSVTERRQTIDRTEQRKVKGRTVTVHLMKFGVEEIPVAAWTVDKGVGLAGAGRKAVDLISSALDRPKGDSIVDNPEFVELDKALGKGAAVRAFIPSATVAGSRIPGGAVLGRALSSAGWTFGVNGGALEFDAFFRLSHWGQERADQIFAASADAPAGVLAALLPDAVIAIEFAVNAKSLLESLSGPEAAELDRAYQDLKEQSGIDVRAEILPKLSGRGALSMGVGDPAKLGNDLRVILQNPARLLWTAASVGLSDPAGYQKVDPFGPRVAPMLAKKGLNRSERKRGDLTVDVISAGEGADRVAMESFVDKGAAMITTEASLTDRVLGASPPADPLLGKPGVFAEVRFQPLAQAVRKIDLGALGVLANKAVAMLARLDRATVSVTPAPGGASLKARLGFAPAQPAAK
jgi:hypothetical protein